MRTRRIFPISLPECLELARTINSQLSKMMLQKREKDMVYQGYIGPFKGLSNAIHGYVGPFKELCKAM